MPSVYGDIKMDNIKPGGVANSWENGTRVLKGRDRVAVWASKWQIGFNAM